MTSIDTVKQALERSHAWSMPILADLKDASTIRGEAGGNHAHWMLGHLVTSESGMTNSFVLNEPNPLEAWRPFFSASTPAIDDTSSYPGWDEVMAASESTRSRTLQILEELNASELAAPSFAPEPYLPMLATKADCFILNAMHWSFHAGQAADIRRGLGRPPLFGG